VNVAGYPRVFCSELLSRSRKCPCPDNRHKYQKLSQP
jgi:hypothetical protein